MGGGGPSPPLRHHALIVRAVRAIGLPGDLFAGVAPRVLAGWRVHAMVEFPSHLCDHPGALLLALLAALLHSRRWEITDTLVELLISTVHQIGARADRKVTEELVDAFQVGHRQGEPAFAFAEAALDPVREMVYPGGVRRPSTRARLTA